jgi:hypothetical protein
MRCRGEVRRRGKGKQCTCRVMSERGARRWLEAGKISSGEYLIMVGDASRPGFGLCPKHAIRALEKRKPGAGGRIYNSRMSWKRNIVKAHTVLRAMSRAGLFHRVKHVEPRAPMQVANILRRKLPSQQCPHDSSPRTSLLQKELVIPDHVVCWS